MGPENELAPEDRLVSWYRKRPLERELTPFQYKVACLMERGFLTSRQIADELHANETRVSDAMDQVDLVRKPRSHFGYSQERHLALRRRMEKSRRCPEHAPRR